MAFEETTGDLFGLGLDAIGHGVNCRGVMGAGIALGFRRRWPAMYQEYRARCRRGEFRLGDFFAYLELDEPHPRVVYNLATQLNPGPNADLLAIHVAVELALDHADGLGMATFGVPRIGAGLGGLYWPAVRDVLAEVAERSPVRLIAVTLPVEEAP